MKIAIITSSLPPDPTGGAERQAAATALRLAERGHRVVVFARALSLEPPGVKIQDGVTWVRIGVPSVPGLSFPAHLAGFLRAWRTHGQRESGLVLAYQVMINGFLGGLIRGTRPLVTWIRSEDEVRLRASRKFRVFTPWVADRSDRVLVQARSIRTRLLEELEATRGPSFAERIAPKITVLPNAISVGSEPDYNGRRELLYIGRLIPSKAVDVIFEAMRLLPSPPPLRILGEGRMQESLKQLAQGLPVTFEGFVSNDELRKRLGQARLMVSVSRTEGFPNSILDAMERGVPVVATPVGAVPEVVEDGVSGALVPVDDPRALADRIQTLFTNDAEWERMARAARAAARGYAWQAHLDRLEAILTEPGSVRLQR